MTASSRAELAAVPGVAATRDADTRRFVFNHTMLRVKDPRASLDFYTRVLGFTLVRKIDFEEAKFSLYFLVLVDEDGDIPESDGERRQWLARQRGVLELTHNHGTEHQPGPVYHDGNGEPRGFGHICVSVPDLRAACARMESLEVPFQKRLSDGRMRDVAFIKDPDGYWIELIQPAPLAD
ncbi:lactoylglutathione lyase [Luteimonas aquatica]|uniref:lactoylglutathione lyase n=1 Tax=Luteimonas aquatica TaxID=450364 RepID=UPI001F5AF917|nr:lactoylglutathione lyase [Luteimonas aquatica]